MVRVSISARCRVFRLPGLMELISVCVDLISFTDKINKHYNGADQSVRSSKYKTN